MVVVLAGAAAALGQGAEKKAAKDAELGKKETSIAPDKSLAGDVTRKKDKSAAAPALQYDQFRLGVEVQVASKRREQIKDLKRIISLSNDPKEMPKLLFRLGELYWEESKFQSFEANRKDDEYIRAMNANDKAGMERAKAEKEQLVELAKEPAKLAVDQYTEIIQKYKDFERSDEVLYFLGQNLMEMGEERKSLVSYKRLIEKYPKSKYLPDAHLAFGEYYFNNSKGKRDMLEKALQSYKDAAKYPENAVYGYALYKQGWCYFNMGEYEKAMDQYKAVLLYAEFAGKDEVEGKEKAGKGSRAGLVKEARNDYVRSYARKIDGTPSDGKDRFSKLPKTNNEDLRTMIKQLANLYYEDGKDKEAAVAFDMLIKERPTSPEAPGYQGKIIDCVMRAGNKRMTVQQVRRLVKIMDDVKAANKQMNEKELKTLEEAKELSERTISNLAVNWHNEAKKTRDDETFGFANEVYADYLTLFPDNAKAYDLRFFWAELLNDNLNKYDKAAEQYTIVVETDIKRKDKCGAPPEKGEDGKPKPPLCRWMVNAAYNAILANDQVVKAVVTSGKLKLEPVSDPNKKNAIHPENKALLEACERYLKHVPEGEKKVEIAYKAAKIYYDYNHLEEAVARFAEIALKYPDHKFENGDKAGEIAANLVLDSYNLQGDWAKVNEWARKFYAEEKLATGKFREDLAKLIEQSAFKLVNQLEAKKEYAKAGEAYINFVQEFPRSEIADKALYNASIDFFNARQLDKAIETRKRIIQNYPKSSYVPQTLFALAEGYEAITDFDNAADHYELYAANYEKSSQGGGAPAPKRAAAKKGKKGAKEKDDDGKKSDQVWEEPKAQIALFNAGVFRDGLGQYKQALRDREHYLELWGESKDAEAVFLSIVDLHEKNGAWQKALKQLEEYEKAYGKDPNKLLTAEGRIATIYDDKLKSDKNAQRIYGRVLEYYEKLPKRTKGALEITALDAVARAQYQSVEPEWRKYEKLRLRWSKLTAIGEFKGSIGEKAKALESVQKAYTQTVTLKSADPAICALHRIGLAFDNFAEALTNPPRPKGMTEDLEFEVKTQLDQQAAPVKDKAAEAFMAAVQKSQELDVFNACTIKSLEKLRTKYRPEQFPRMGEDTAEMKMPAGKQMALGDDVLTAVQAIPSLSPSQAAELKAASREVARNTDDLQDRPPRDEPKPAVRTAPSTNNTTAKKKTKEEEPDEPL